MRLTSGLFALVGKWSKKYSNLPDRYIKRTMEVVYWRTPRGKPQYLPRTVGRKAYYFSVHRPWTNPFQIDNRMQQKPVLIEPIKHWSFFRGDLVEILTGPDKGKQGYVKDIIQERNWVFVEGLNTKVRREKTTKSGDDFYMQEEQPLLVTSQVQLVDPSDMKATPIEWRYTAGGEHVRVSVRTGKIIPIPLSSEETIDYVQPSSYRGGLKDTSKEDVLEVTFECALKTFDMDIMDRMGIKEDRVPKPYYWY